MTSVPITANLAKFLSKHVTERKTGTIEGLEGSDMDSPSIKTTKTHIAFLVPKKMAWIALLAALVGGPSLLTYVVDRAGLVTRDELTKAVTEAVVASQKATQEAVNKAVTEAVAPLKAEIETMKAQLTLQFQAIDVRATKLERANANKPKEPKP